MDNVLVTVIVPTYNSSQTVIETLDSIYNQTFKDIELIVTDDGSKDDSVFICREWLAVHGGRFFRTKLIESPVNTGISANINRALKVAKGSWLKPIAADDHLMPESIETLVNHISEHPEQRIVFAKVVGFGDLEAADKWPFKNVKWLFDNLSFKEMKILLTQTNFLPAASVFIKMDVFDEVGYFEEAIPLLEDWPFWVKAVFHNIPLHFCDEYVAEYRFSSSSVSQVESGLSPMYLESERKSFAYARKHESQISLLMSFYFITFNLKYRGSYLGKFFYLFNVVNPEYYLFKRVKRKFHFFCY